jgi:hypothetical protein
LGNQLTSLTLPDSVTHIGALAFAENQLANVIVPDSVIYLADNAFDENVRIIRP